VKRIRLPSAIGAALTAIVVTAMLGDRFLTAPPGVFVYLPLAALVLWCGYLISTLVLTWGRPLPPYGGTPATRLGVHGAIITLTAVSVAAVPFAAGTLEERLYHSDPIQ
jgi:hypothetical protein